MGLYIGAASLRTNATLIKVKFSMSCFNFLEINLFSLPRTLFPAVSSKVHVVCTGVCKRNLGEKC